MTIITRRAAIAAAGASLAMPYVTGAQAQSALTVQIGASHPIQNFWVANMKEVFQPEVDKHLRDNGNSHKINWREAYGGTLFKFQDTMEAVRDNLVDVGFVGTLWEGSTMPLQNLTYFTPFSGGDHGLVANAFDKLNASVPALKESWNKLNMAPLSSLITDSYHLWTNFPIKSLDDLKNRKINAPGTSANWLTGTGATPVDGALTTYYTDIQTGVSEGAISFYVGILPTRVYEVAKYVTEVDLGAMYVGGIAANLDRFNKFPKPVQDAMVAAGKAATAAHVRDVANRIEKSKQEMIAKGAIVTKLADADRERWIKGLPNIAKTWADSSGPAARDMLKTYFDTLRGSGFNPPRAWDKEV
ncbi:MAG: C4-dicarboxylate TRAP transporter substrate-binding protein [Methylobacteriaceae bacterium]|nr:C4-dicarboxylate TRAP transporter substrate-binding protein [Methylobacteriaceae bacterium]